MDRGRKFATAESELVGISMLCPANKPNPIEQFCFHPPAARRHTRRNSQSHTRHPSGEGRIPRSLLKKKAPFWSPFVKCLHKWVCWRASDGNGERGPLQANLPSHWPSCLLGPDAKPCHSPSCGPFSEAGKPLPAVLLGALCPALAVPLPTPNPQKFPPVFLCFFSRTPLARVHTDLFAVFSPVKSATAFHLRSQAYSSSQSASSLTDL